MVVVPKKNGSLSIFLDPQDPNCAILREHYPLPTIEDVATQLHGARVFTVLDVSKGFWHIELDESSSFLTTFNTHHRFVLGTCTSGLVQHLKYSSGGCMN